MGVLFNGISILGFSRMTSVILGTEGGCDRGDIGRRVAALVLPISNRARVTSSCAGKIGLREPGEVHAKRPGIKVP